MKFAGTNAISKGLGNALETISEVGSLPLIRGQWFFVDPTGGSNTSDGRTIDTAVANLTYAYDKAADGDGIALLSYGATSAATTSYLTQSLTWSKNGITVVGVAAPVAMFGRARVANLEVTTGASTVISFTNSGSADTINRSTGSFIADGFVAGQKITVDSTSNTNDGNYTIASVAALALTLSASDSLTTEDAATAGSTTVATYNPEMIVVSGSNNRFFGVHIANFSSNVAAIGGVKVTGNRNYFERCHLIGAGHATPGAAATAYNLKIDGGQENTFRDCVFGTDTVLWAATNAGIVFDTDAWRTRFYDCEFLVQTTTATAGAIMSTDATALDGWQIFKDCTFLVWNDNGVSTVTALVIGTKPNSGQILLQNCANFGFAAYGAAGMSGCVYVAAPAVAASAGGGIATTI